MSNILDVTKDKFIIIANKSYIYTRKRNVVNQVKIYRKNMQLSQLDLANQVGVARQTINMIENDKYNPTLDLCLKIAWALESDLNTLFWRDNDENNAG